MLRHDLRRGPAPVCGVAVGLCAPVPGPDGQARRGLDRGPLAGDLDRPEDDLAQPRSTVGTVTEIYDYLRLLWARIGHPHCHSCGAPIAGQSAEQIVDHLMTIDEGTRFMVMAPVVRGRKGEYKDLLEELRTDGYTLGEDRRRAAPASRTKIELDKKYKHDIAVVVDRLQMKPDARKRLADSIETAVALGEGIVEVEMVDGASDRPPYSTGAKRARRESAGTLVFSEKFSCLECGASMPELEPRIFSFNSPQGACQRCTGLGSQHGDRPRPRRPGPEAVGQRGGDPPLELPARLLRAARAGIGQKFDDRPRHALGGPPRARTRTSSSTAMRASASMSPTATGWAGGVRTWRPSRG